MRAISLVLAVCAALFATAAQAAVMKDLYQANVTVAGKGGKARAGAFQDGLKQVLVKVTGQRAVLGDASVQELLDHPQRSVQEYSYSSIDDSAEDGTPRYRLAIHYAPARIKQQLQAADVPVWGQYRPGILVWLAVDGNDGRRIVDSGKRSRAAQALVTSAHRRALPIQLPQMDARDRSQVAFADIASGAFNRLQEAAQRYRPGILVVATVEQRGGGDWSGHWTLLGTGARRSWDVSGHDRDAAIAAGVDAVTDRVAKIDAGQKQSSRRLRIEVRGVAGLSDYARVSRYLDGLGRVKRHVLAGAKPNQLAFDLWIRGRVTDFERTIRLGNRLRRIEGATSTATSEQPATRSDSDTRSDSEAPADSRATSTDGERTTDEGAGRDAVAQLVADASRKRQPVAPDLTYMLLQ